MSLNYIKNNLSKDENILLSAKTTPWFYLPTVILCVIWALISLLTIKQSPVMVFIFLFSVVYGIYVYLKGKCVEMAVTNKRIILEKGIIATSTEEIRLEKCEGIKLEKGLLGIFFNYGTLNFSGTGNSNIKWQGISNPKDTRKKIEDIFDIYQKK